MKARGFTLVEVLVALVIVTLGMAALFASMTSSADTTIYLRDKTLAEWIALNQVEAMRLSGNIPAVGKTTGDVENYAGRRWHWEQEIKKLELKGAVSIEVSVRPAEIAESNKGLWYATAIGVMGDAVNYNGGSAADWDQKANAINQVQPPNPNGEN